MAIKMRHVFHHDIPDANVSSFPPKLNFNSSVVINKNNFEGNNISEETNVGNNIIAAVKRSVFNCKHCNFTARCASALKRHMVVHSDERPFICTMCSKSFKRSCGLQQHEMHVHGKFPEGKERIECKQCGFTASTMSHLRQHERTHFIERPFECKICSKNFKQKQSLRSHMISHREDRLFKCEICSKTFRRKASLKSHMRVHSKLRPYKCSVCSKAFKTKGEVKNHLVVHSDKRPFKCSNCSTTFKRKGDWKRHLLRHCKNVASI